MGRRLELHEILLQQGTSYVYFQPPNNLQINYPCIVYTREAEDVKYADNSAYHRKKRYLVTVIDRNPDSQIPDNVGSLPLCRLSRHFTADNLHHDAYNLFY